MIKLKLFYCRTYYVQNIPHSNLILLVLLKDCDCYEESIKSEPRESELSEQESCDLLKGENFRKGPERCFKQHDQVYFVDNCYETIVLMIVNSQEEEIKFCGKAVSLDSLPLTWILSITLLPQIWLFACS